MDGWKYHLLVAPIVLPLVAGALLVMYDERRPFLKGMINLLSTLAMFLIAIVLIGFADTSAIGVYPLGNWPAPFGIVLVLDRLAAIMLVLTATLALAALIFSLAKWHKAGAHFHSMFQFLLMGVNGAFLTGDLFNLFVFFEVLLASSYGLMLHGSGSARVRAGLHYIIINLAASFLFLIGVSLIYGASGTLNMADLARRIATMASEDRPLLEAGAGVLAIAFLVKAAAWPLCFWLVNTYAATSAPVAAVFAILSKVGIYVLMRLSPLFFGTGAGDSAGFGTSALMCAGFATIAYGMIGVLASQGSARLAGYSILVSSGTALSAIGIADAAATEAALFYIVSSTLTIGALFLLIELIERGQSPAADLLAVTAEAYGEEEEEEHPGDTGSILPGAAAIPGVCYGGCALLLSGLPPLSGFIGKFALLRALVDQDLIPLSNWIFMALLVFSGLAALLAMSRAGIRMFWAPIDATVPRISTVEIVPIVLLLSLTLALTVNGGTVMQYMEKAAQSVHAPTQYADDVLRASRTGSADRENTP